MKSKLLKCFFIIALSAILAVMPGLQIFADTLYFIEDIVVATGSSVSAAKRSLPKGYVAVAGDLNARNEGVVVIGVKRTLDRSKAITDLRVMNMNGRYSFEDYENVLKEKQEAADEMVDTFYTAILEFRENYKAGKIAALIAYELLNRLTDEDFCDTDAHLGSILVNENTTRSQLSVIFMQATTIAVGSIESCLGIGCSSNWINDFINMPENTTYEPKDDEDARIIFDTLKRFQEEMKSYGDIYKASGIPGKSFEDEEAEKAAWKAYYDTLSEENKAIVDNYANTYDYLRSSSYKNGTLLDFFMQDLTKIDNSALYPMAKAMTDGQIATLPYSSFCNAIQYSMASDKTLKDVLDALKREENIKEISIFEGVDRSIFNADGIALTDQAKQYATSASDTSWYKGNLSKETEDAFYGIIGAVAGIAAISAAVAVYASIQVSAIVSMAYQAAFADLSFVSTGLLVEATEVGVIGGESITVSSEVMTISQAEISAARAAATAQGANSAWATVASVAKIITAVAIAIVLITVIIFLIKEYRAYNEKKKNYTVIPRIIVEQTYNDDNSRKYTYYYAVKDTKGDYADLNNWDGTQWNALYYTKDTTVGSPIYADAITQSTNISNNASYKVPVCGFSEKAAYNMNTYADNKAGIYLFFQGTGTSTGTSVSYGTYSIVAAAGIAVGVIGTLIISKLLRKKKKNL